MQQVKQTGIYRSIAKLFPLRYKLNFLIGKYLALREYLSIPFNEAGSIVILPNTANAHTINEFIFQGASYLPEYELFKKIKASLPKGYSYVDVGSNLGATMLIMYDPAATVTGFEPVKSLSDSVTQTIELNRFENVKIINAAVGNSTGELMMLDNDNSSVITDNISNTGQAHIKVPVLRLDDYFKAGSRIDLLKIDVEGFELEVLKGALKVLQTSHPRLLIELHPLFLRNYGVETEEVISVLESHGYHIRYFNFLTEARLSRLLRFFSRYKKNNGIEFSGKAAFYADTLKTPAVMSYHIYCE